jgi:hypothetical protein
VRHLDPCRRGEELPSFSTSCHKIDPARLVFIVLKRISDDDETWARQPQAPGRPNQCHWPANELKAFLRLAH